MPAIVNYSKLQRRVLTMCLNQQRYRYRYSGRFDQKS